MSEKAPFDEYEPEGHLDKLLRKTQDNPLVPIGKSFHLRLMSSDQIICKIIEKFGHIRLGWKIGDSYISFLFFSLSHVDRI